MSLVCDVVFMSFLAGYVAVVVCNSNLVFAIEFSLIFSAVHCVFQWR